MKKKEIIGIILIAGGIGALSYLYNGYFKAYKEAMEQKAKETKTTK